MHLTPIVIEQTPRGERSFDIYSRLLQDRIILIFGEIDDCVASSVIAQLLFLTSLDKDKDIYLYINSPGGTVSAGFAIFDVMRYIKPDVVTIGMGLCASMGAFILASGKNGKRYALPNTKIMIHQPLGGVKGPATDIVIVAEEINRTKKIINEILAQVTNQPLSKIAQDVERDFYLNACDAKKYGLIDHLMMEDSGVKANPDS